MRREDFNNMNINENAQKIIDRMIAIDTEYHVDKLGRIDKVFCICASNDKGKYYKYWIDNDAQPQILKDIANFYNIENPIYVCHAFSIAERRALKFLKVNCNEYDFICTHHMAKMLQNSFSKSSNRIKSKTIFESDEEQYKYAINQKTSDLSYAGLCHKYHLALIDTEHKEAMRHLCIEDNTCGHENDILDYCASDTQFLIPLFKRLFNDYYKALKGSFCPLKPGMFDQITPVDAASCLIQQLKSINDFGDIADQGIPVDMQRVELVKKNAFKYREKLKDGFNKKYPETFKRGRDNLLHENTENILNYLESCIKECKIQNYPKSEKSGKLSRSSDVLKEYFKGRDCFGEHYRQLNKLVRKLNVVSKQDDNPFNYIINQRLWYEDLKPYGTITSRCTPSTKRFIFGWHKSLYGVMNPSKDKWLIELDFGSEETFIQACICQDSAYHDIYNSKDIYLAFANKMGYIPNDDWNNLSKDELKDKYSDIRQSIKTLILGLSYGMGYKKLAQRLDIPTLKAQNYTEKVKRIIKKSTMYKDHLVNKLKTCSAFSLPDGFICRGASTFMDNNTTTVINFPFQSAGGTILRNLVSELMTLKRNNQLDANILATIHDAIFFEVNAGDYATIEKVSNIMKDCANKTLSAVDYSIKVGKPDIIKHGDIWCAGNSNFVEQFKELLNFRDDD